MKLHSLSPTPGTRKNRKRVGRGDSSGWGRTAGRGEKGQKSRTGASHKYYFEGGQIPLFRRLPKRGFKSLNPAQFNIVNVGVFEKFFEVGNVVDEKLLREKGIIGKHNFDLKILADGNLSKALTVRASKFSKAAAAKIEAAGGKCETV